MKHFFRILLLVVLFVVDQPLSWSQKNIKSKITKNHVLVKGTKIRMIPPSGFTSDGLTINGFKNESSDAAIVVIHNPVGFNKSIEGVTKETLAKQGLKNIVFKDIKVNSMPGLYISGQQSVYGLIFNKTLLFFGNDKESSVISTTYNDKNTEEGKILAKSINSVFFDEKLVIDPVANLDYYFSNHTLIFAKVVNTSIIYNADGMLPTKTDKPISLLASKANITLKIDDKSKYAKERLSKFNIVIDSINSTEEINIDGLPAVEIIAVGKEKGSDKSSIFYQLMIFEEKTYYIIYGSTNNEFEKNMPLIQNMSRSFMRKK